MNTRGQVIVCIGNLLVWFFFYKYRGRKELQFSPEKIKSAFITLGMAGFAFSVFHLWMLVGLVKSFKGVITFGISMYSLFLLTDFAYIYVGSRLDKILSRKSTLALVVLFANGVALVIHALLLTIASVESQQIGASLFSPIELYAISLIARLLLLLIMGINVWRLMDEFDPPSESEKISDYSNYT